MRFPTYLFKPSNKHFYYSYFSWLSNPNTIMLDFSAIKFRRENYKTLFANIAEITGFIRHSKTVCNPVSGFMAFRKMHSGPQPKVREPFYLVCFVSFAQTVPNKLHYNPEVISEIDYEFRRDQYLRSSRRPVT